ncbi:MAG: hypothetical protein AAGM33_08225 [Pseudomonadota bacterium]
MTTYIAKFGWASDHAMPICPLAANNNTNFLNVWVQRHAWFTKDFVPLAGRDNRVRAKFSF